MLNEPQLQLLERIAQQGIAGNMDVGVGANVLHELVASLRAERAARERAQEALRDIRRTNPGPTILALVRRGLGEA